MLQTVEGIEIALREIARAAGFDELRIQGENFFLRAAGRQCGLIRLCCLDLSLGASGLRAYVDVIKLQQELAPFHVIAFFDKQALHRGRDGSVRFEILNGLNFAVGGDNTADRATFNPGSTYFERSLVGIGIQDGQKSQQSECEPNPTPSGRRVRVFRRCQPIVFQFAAGITVSINLPSQSRER